MSKKSTFVNRVTVPEVEILAHMGNQLHFLEKSVADYDQGDYVEYIRMAQAMRVLLYDKPPHARSILAQIKVPSAFFVSYAAPLDERNLLPEFSLAHIEFKGRRSTMIPALDKGAKPNWLSFCDWWKEPVLRAHDKQLYNREDFIRYVANQDGGAHVDAAIDPKFHYLKSGGALLWRVHNLSGSRAIEGIEKVYIRHIAFEVLQSFELIIDNFDS